MPLNILIIYTHVLKVKVILQEKCEEIFYQKGYFLELKKVKN